MGVETGRDVLRAGIGGLRRFGGDSREKRNAIRCQEQVEKESSLLDLLVEPGPDNHRDNIT